MQSGVHSITSSAKPSLPAPSDMTSKLQKVKLDLPSELRARSRTAACTHQLREDDDRLEVDGEGPQDLPSHARKPRDVPPAEREERQQGGGPNQEEDPERVLRRPRRNGTVMTGAARSADTVDHPL